MYILVYTCIYHVHTCIYFPMYVPCTYVYVHFRICTYTYIACMVYVHTIAFDISLYTMYIHVCTWIYQGYRIPDARHQMPVSSECPSQSRATNSGSDGKGGLWSAARALCVHADSFSWPFQAFPGLFKPFWAYQGLFRAF